MSETPKYELQVLLPHQDTHMSRYIDSGGYWSTVASSGSLPYLEQQRDIMVHFWKRVRIVLPEHIKVEMKVIE